MTKFAYDSSCVKNVAIDNAQRTAEVLFQNGSKYAYRNVSQAGLDVLNASDPEEFSLGGWVNAYLKGPEVAMQKI